METYLNELDKLSLRDAGVELDGMRRGQLSELASLLGIPTRYDGGTLKSKEVLAAAVYEVLREQREREAGSN